MEQYIYKRTLMAERATKAEAEKRLGVRISNLFYGNNGYIFIDPETNENGWVTQSVFEKSSLKNDTLADKFARMGSEIQGIVDELRLFNKKGKPSREMRKKIYMSVRRLDTLRADFDILNEMAKNEKR